MSTKSPQEVFNERYISSSEICKTLGVNRTNLHHKRKTGGLPGAIVIGDQKIVLWERDFIAPYLSDWKVALDAKRTQRA